MNEPKAAAVESVRLNTIPYSIGKNATMIINSREGKTM
jgi:hypothetical protein